jgi:hypothetical protein
MITGMHAVIFSIDPEKDRAFFRDVLRFPNVDVGQGWLIFAAPPSELAFHPSDRNDRHELYLMCDDVNEQVKVLEHAGCTCTPISDESWGLLTSFSLPGGGSIGLYQPKHAPPPRTG